MHKGCKGRGRMGQLARAKTGVGARQLKSWRANLAVGAPTMQLARAMQVPSWRANFDLASKKLASTQKTHILQHINKATQTKSCKISIVPHVSCTRRSNNTVHKYKQVECSRHGVDQELANVQYLGLAS